MKMIYKNIQITAFLTLSSISCFVNAGGISTKPISQVTAFLETFNYLAEEFALTQTQKNQMISTLYEHGPKMLKTANQMFINRTELLAEHIEQSELSIDWIESHADKQGQLLKQLIIDKELLRQDVNSILNSNQRAMLTELLDQFLWQRLG